MAVADLGGLGAKEGRPVVYNWTLPNLLPAMLPWLAVLLLLLLKPNRCAQAWWIWVPVGCVTGLAATLQSELDFMSGVEQDLLWGCANAAAFGLAAVWLIAGYLGWKHRALAWLGMSFAMASFSLLALGIRQATEGMGPETVAGAILLIVGTAVISAALTVAGLVCRGHYRPVRLYLWLLPVLLVFWFLATGCLFVVARAVSFVHTPLMVLAGLVAAVAVISFGLVSPFLILSFANAFYRARLKALLHMGRETTPPVLAPPVPAAHAAVGG